MPRTFLLPLLCLALFVSSACQPRQPEPPQLDIGEAIAFETIEAAKGSAGYPEHEPTSYLLWDHHDVAEIEGWLLPSAIRKLKDADFEEYAVVVVLQGLKGTNGYDVVIERVGLRNGNLMIVAQFWENPPTMGAGAEMTSPYHLIKVAKNSGILPDTKIELHSYTQYHRVQ